VIVMARIRLFASAREAAGVREDRLPGATVGDVLDAAVARYGPVFGGVLGTATVWCNGDAVDRDHEVGADDEVAILPPVSGGSDVSAESR
jgi:sulfur-carrier protein